MKTGDFNELKSIVSDLAVAQKETQYQVQALAHKLDETNNIVQALARNLDETNNTVGGLGRSFAYALENEAYRMIPALLEKKYSIKMTERFVRTFIGGEEINLFGRGQRDGKDIIIVGETKLRLDERRKDKAGQMIFEQLAAKADVVREEYPGAELVLILITHHARPSVLKKAREKGVIVIQSFEW